MPYVETTAIAWPLLKRGLRDTGRLMTEPEQPAWKFEHIGEGPYSAHVGKPWGRWPPAPGDRAAPSAGARSRRPEARLGKLCRGCGWGGSISINENAYLYIYVYNMYVYTYIYIHMHSVCVYIYICVCFVFLCFLPWFYKLQFVLILGNFCHFSENFGKLHNNQQITNLQQFEKGNITCRSPACPATKPHSTKVSRHRDSGRRRKNCHLGRRCMEVGLGGYHVSTYIHV